MTSRSDHSLEDLKAKVARLERAIEQRQYRAPVVAAPFIVVAIVGGNTLADSSDGVKYVAGGVASVPSAYDPNVTSTFIDGIGRGQLSLDGWVQPGYVLVVADNRSPIAYALKAGEYVATPIKVQIPIDGTSPVESVTAYVPVWV